MNLNTISYKTRHITDEVIFKKEGCLVILSLQFPLGN